MNSIECSICSERFGINGGGGDSNDVIVTPCGHVYHETCISKWLHGRYCNFLV